MAANIVKNAVNQANKTTLKVEQPRDKPVEKKPEQKEVETEKKGILDRLKKPANRANTD